MRTTATRRTLFRDTMSLSGWLFADLLLGLAMLFLVFNTKGVEAPKPIPPTPTVQPTYTPYPTLTSAPTYTLQPTYTALPTYTPQIIPTPQPTTSTGIELTPLKPPKLHVNPDRLLANNQAELNLVRQYIHQHFDQFNGSRKAGVVITFGSATASNYYAGDRIAAKVNDLLASELPAVFSGAVRRAFHTLTGNRAAVGDIEIEIYLFNK